MRHRLRARRVGKVYSEHKFDDIVFKRMSSDNIVRGLVLNVPYLVAQGVS